MVQKKKTEFQEEPKGKCHEPGTNSPHLSLKYSIASSTESKSTNHAGLLFTLLADPFNLCVPEVFEEVVIICVKFIFSELIC